MNCRIAGGTEHNGSGDEEATSAECKHHGRVLLLAKKVEFISRRLGAQRAKMAPGRNTTESVNTGIRLGEA